MKNIMIKSLALAAVVILTAACVKDKGDYDYKSRESIFPVKISKLVNYLNVVPVVLNERLQLDVEQYITGTEGGHYAYRWLCVDGAGNIKLYETQDHPNFDQQINDLKVGNYTFHLEIIDPDKKLVVRSGGISVEVSGGYGQGWYVYKSTGDGFGNIDLVEDINNFVEPQTPETESGKPMKKVRSNVIASDVLPQGEPFHIGYMPWYSADVPVLDESGNPTGKNTIMECSTVPPAGYPGGQLGAFMVVTRNNIWTIRALDMLPIRTKFEDNFFFPPSSNVIESIQFYDFKLDNGSPAGMMEFAVHMIIDGQEHIYSALRAGPGRFSQPKMGYNSQPYNLAPFVARCYFGPNMAFDKLNHRFVQVTSTVFKYNVWPDNVKGYGLTTKQPDGMPNMNNMPYDLVWMGESARGDMSTYVTVLMKSTTGNDYVLLLPAASALNNAMTHALTALYDSAYPFDRMVVVEPGSKLLDPAAVRFMVRGRTDVYFGLGNTIYWYRTPDIVEGMREEPLINLPAGEVIKDVKTIRNSIKDDPNSGAWYALVLSNDAAGNWHLRAFRTTDTAGVALSKSDIDAMAGKPEFHYTGTGTAADVAYRGSQYLIINN